uniref:Protein phosphatase 1, regulatory (Inhibitor) subunit 13 like n=4 Tax=Nothobranchiidae TaxID=405002 RepID=A0A1A7W611_9TELE
MSSQAAFGSSMLFQSINEDLNASLSVADELSKEFSSMMTEASSSSNNTMSQTSQNVSKNKSGPSSSTWASGIGTNGSSGPGSGSGSGSRTLSQSSTYFSPLDSGMSSSRNAPSPPVMSTSPHSSPKISRAALPSHRRSGSDSYVFMPQSPKPSPLSPRPGSPSFFERTPQGSIGYRDRASPPTLTSGSLDQSSRPVSHQASYNLLNPNDNSQMGLRSPRPSPLTYRSPSPLPYSSSSSNSLPRNLYSSGQTDEGMKKQKSPNRWNESDLDTPYDRKPHHTYDKTEWMRTAAPNSGWRESNLDGPPPASSPKKDLRLSSQQGSYNSLPRNARISVPPDVQPQSHYRETKSSPYYQPSSRISVPPTYSQARQSIKVPVSAILRLQNPHFGVMTPRLPQVLERERDAAAYQPGIIFPKECFRKRAFKLQQRPAEQRQPAFYSDALHSSDVDAEIERLDSVQRESPTTPGGSAEVEQDVAQAVAPPPRPLSPTRLQPVVAPEAQSDEIPDIEEVFRMRAEIPRPLRRRSSVDTSHVQSIASLQQPNQYKNLIGKLFRKKDKPPKEEQGSDNGSSSEGEDAPLSPAPEPVPQIRAEIPQGAKNYSSILRSSRSVKSSGRRARLSPLVLLLDGALMGELETVKKAVQEMTDPSQPNDEGITGLHNAICGGHYNLVDFLVRAGANVSAPDSHGWTPLHCAASCNDRVLCEFLVRNGAAIMAKTESDGATPFQKCDPFLDNCSDCENYLQGAEDAMGVENNGVLYALWSHQAQAADELTFKDGDMVTILLKPEGSDWWWASLRGKEGFVPNNYFGLFPKVRPKSLC